MSQLLEMLTAVAAQSYPWAVALIDWILQAVVFGSALAGLTWLATATLFRRAGSALHAAFWMIVLIKFLVPAGPGWSLSLANLIPDVRLAAASGVAAPAMPLQSPVGATENPSLSQVVLPVTADIFAREAGAAPSAWTTPYLLPAASAAYVAAVLLVAVVRLRSYRAFVVACLKLPPADTDVCGIVASACRRAGLKRVPDTRIGDRAGAPFVFGVLRPTLVLSPRQLADSAELEAVVLHETAHLRRGDLWIRYLQWIAGTVLFFWPVVAWVNRRIDLAREHACDEWALRHGRLSPGQYARCLLRAASPQRGSPFAWRPAAMASNLKHVERRIEMILDTHASRSRHPGRAGLAGAALLGWSALSLTGATAPTDPPAANAPQSAGGGTVVARSLSEECGPPDFLWLMGPDCPPEAAGNKACHFFIATDDSQNGESDHFAALWVMPPSESQLSEFGAAYPAADLDANGAVTAVERDAYLAAMALASPQAVLTQFPRGDLNGNAALELNEAARLVTAGIMPEIRRFERRLGDGELIMQHLSELPEAVRAKLHATVSGDGAQKVEVVRVNEQGERQGDGDAKECKVVVCAPKECESGQTSGRQEFQVIAGGPGAGEGKEIRIQCVGGTPGEPPVVPAVWISENVSATPTREQAAACVPAVEQAPLDFFLELNPKADANQDGTLTVEERDAFVKYHATRHRQRMLERFPDADANGDGLLTNEELKAFMAARHGDADVMRFEDGDGNVRIMRVRKSDGGAQTDVDVQVTGGGQ